MGRRGQAGKDKKKGMNFISYDYEAAYSKQLGQLHEWVVRNMFAHQKKVVYALKEITAGEQFEVEIYPQFRKMDEVPEEGRRIVRDNSRAQKNLNDKNARKYVERKINQNFGDRDIWMTLTYDDGHLPPDGDIDAAEKDMVNYIKRINYQRKKRGLPKADYIYVTEYSPRAAVRWHHHIVMDGALDMDIIEKCWKKGGRNEVRRLKKDENGLSGLANYIVKQKERLKSEKRWHCSQGLKEPGVRVVHSKQPEKGKGSYKPIGKFVVRMIKNQDMVREVLAGWYPEFDFTDASVYYNDFNYMFYIRARMRKKDRGEKGNEHEICSAERGYGADCSHPVGAVQREPPSGIKMAASLSERRKQEPDGGGQVKTDGC